MSRKTLLIGGGAVALLCILFFIGQPSDGLVRRDTPIQWWGWLMIVLFVVFIIALIRHAFREQNGKK